MPPSGAKIASRAESHRDRGGEAFVGSEIIYILLRRFAFSTAALQRSSVIEINPHQQSVIGIMGVVAL
jgi:hypothetical protein